MQISDAGRNIMLDGVVGLLDLGTTNASGTIYIYDSSKVTTLATIPMNNPSFADATAGTVNMIVVPEVEDTSADATGVAAEMTITDRDDNIVFSGSVGVSASGKDLELNSTNIEIGVPVRITSCVFTQPAGFPAA